MQEYFQQSDAMRSFRDKWQLTYITKMRNSDDPNLIFVEVDRQSGAVSISSIREDPSIDDEA